VIDYPNGMVLYRLPSHVEQVVQSHAFPSQSQWWRATVTLGNRLLLALVCTGWFGLWLLPCLGLQQWRLIIVITSWFGLLALAVVILGLYRSLSRDTILLRRGYLGIRWRLWPLFWTVWIPLDQLRCLVLYPRSTDCDEDESLVEGKHRELLAFVTRDDERHLIWEGRPGEMSILANDLARRCNEALQQEGAVIVTDCGSWASCSWINWRNNQSKMM
jgi:hypothetical protein